MKPPTCVSEHPILVKQWHPVNNGKLKPSDVAPHSNNPNIWWKCSKGHSYQMSPNKRLNGRGCRLCKKQTSLIEYCLFICIYKSYPSTTTQYKIKARWKMDIFMSEQSLCIEYDGYRWHKDNIKRDEEKNSILKEFGTVVRVREEGLPSIDGCHIISVENSRKNNGFNTIREKVIFICREMNQLFNLQIKLEFTKEDYLTALEEIHVNLPKNPLSEVNPVLSGEWCYEKNGELTPHMLTAGSHSEVYWKCSRGHVWSAVVYSRKKNGCPYCNNQKVSPENSIFEREKWILEKWDYERNKRNPINISSGASEYVFLFPCVNGHEPRRDRLNRIIADKGECKLCKKMEKSIGKRRKDILEEWNEELNKDIDPFLINEYATTCVYLNCTCCSEPYFISLRNRSRRVSSMCSKCDLKTGKKEQSIQRNRLN